MWLKVFKIFGNHILNWRFCRILLYTSHKANSIIPASTWAKLLCMHKRVKLGSFWLAETCELLFIVKLCPSTKILPKLYLFNQLLRWEAWNGVKCTRCFVIQNLFCDLEQFLDTCVDRLLYTISSNSCSC